MFQDYKVSYLRRNVAVREVKPQSFLRQSVALVLSESHRAVPQASMFTEIDMTPVVEYCKANGLTRGAGRGDRSSRRETPRDLTAFLVKSIAHALYHVPCLNGFFDYTPIRNGGTLYYADDINLAVTVATSYGTISPFVHNPHLMEFDALVARIKDLVARARKTDPDELYLRCALAYLKEAMRECSPASFAATWMLIRGLLKRRKPDPQFRDVPEEEKLKPEEVLGATCTFTHLGVKVRGTQTGTLLVPPQVCYFGAGDLRQAALVVDGKVEPRWVIDMMGAMDHRAFDAGEVYPFQRKFARYIKKPELIYEWKTGGPI